MAHSTYRLPAVLSAIIVLVLLLPGVATAQPPSPVSVSARADRSSAAPGDRVVVAVILDHEMHFHTWPSEAQDVLPPDLAAMAIRTEIELRAEGLPIDVGPVQWPTPSPAPVPDLSGGGGTIMAPTYQGRAIADIPIIVDAEAEPGTLNLPVRVHYQACNDQTCYAPTTETPKATVEIVRADAAASTTGGAFAGFDAGVFDDASVWGAPTDSSDGAASGANVPGTRSEATFFSISVAGAGLVLIGILGFAGGLILNLTPCVLPVIPIKILTLSQHAGQSRARTLFLGIWMALGVIGFWVAIGVPVAILLEAFPDPSRLFGIWWVTVPVGLIIGAMGVGIMGAFSINLPKQVYMVNPKADSAWGSFLFGVMTAVLGLPCFGFVAGALVPAAITQGRDVVLVLFTSMGVGMAAPYFLLSAFPGLIKKMPRTGPASELVKQIMGLLLIAAAFYFIGAGVFALIKSDPVRAASLPWWAKSVQWWLITLASVGAGGWLLLRTIQITKRPVPRVAFGLVAMLFIGAGVVLSVNRTNKALHDFWSPYTAEVLEGSINDGKVVVIDFTADWCINCQFLKATILERDPVKAQLRSDGVVPLIADLTSNAAPGWGKLNDLGRTGIPTLAIYGPGLAEPWVANAYTSDQVMRALDEARGGGQVASAGGVQKGD
jgi:thiol:disulfide interchange protein DsbD